MSKYPLKGKVNSETNDAGSTAKAGKGVVVDNTSSTQDALKKGSVH